MSQKQTKRDSSGNLVEISGEPDEIRGPLGIWPFPILNLILSNNEDRVVITEINRDKDGRIQSLEEFKL